MKNSKKSVIKSLAKNDKDTGSSEVQIGLLTNKYTNFQNILKNLKKTNIHHLVC